MKNPACSWETRFEPAKVVPLRENLSLIEWLEARGRFATNDSFESEKKDKDLEDAEEVYEDLMTDEGFQLEEEEDSINEI